MKKIEEVRRQNLLRLVAEKGGERAIYEKVGVTQGYLSQLKAGGPTLSKSGRNMGEKTARKWEQALGLRSGYFDSNHYMHDGTLSHSDLDEAALKALDKMTIEKKREWVAILETVAKQADEGNRQTAYNVADESETDTQSTQVR